METVESKMPLMNGLDAIVAIRSEFPDACLVVLTTYQGDVQALRALKAGAMSPVIEELLQLRVSQEYFQHLRHKLQRAASAR